MASRFSASNVTVAVSNYNGLSIVGSCLESIGRLNAAPAEIVVLDDGSTDGSVAYLRHHFPSVRVIEMGVNSGGILNKLRNRALAEARADFVFLVDNDVTLAPDCLDQLLSGLETFAARGGVPAAHGLRARSVDNLSRRAGAALCRHEPRRESELPARRRGQHAAFDDRLGRPAHRQGAGRDGRQLQRGLHHRVGRRRRVQPQDEPAETLLLPHPRGGRVPQARDGREALPRVREKPLAVHAEFSGAHARAVRAGAGHLRIVADPVSAQEARVPPVPRGHASSGRTAGTSVASVATFNAGG